MTKKILNARNIILAMGMTLLSLFYISYVVYGVKTKINGGVDYLAHYSAGYIMEYGDAAQVFDLDAQKSVQDRVFTPIAGARFYPYNHPPLLLGALKFLTDENYVLSYFRWLLALVLIYLLSLAVLFRLTQFLDWKRSPDLGIFFVSSVFFYPTFLAYIRGQDSPFLLLGIVLWTLGVLTSRDRLAGLGLALALVRPQIVLALAAPFLFKRQRVLAWFILFSLFLLAYAYLLIGSQGLIGFANMLIFSGKGYGFDVDKMVTVMGAIQRNFPAIAPQNLHVLGYGAYFAAILLLCVVWAKSREIEFKHIGLALLTGMVAAPHMHSHDFVILLIPTLGAALVLIRSGALSEKYAALLPLVVSLTLLLKDITDIFLLPYLLFALLAGILWSQPQLKERFGTPSG